MEVVQRERRGGARTAEVMRVALRVERPGCEVLVVEDEVPAAEFKGERETLALLWQIVWRRLGDEMTRRLLWRGTKDG